MCEAYDRSQRRSRSSRLRCERRLCCGRILLAKQRLPWSRNVYGPRQLRHEFGRIMVRLRRRDVPERSDGLRERYQSSRPRRLRLDQHAWRREPRPDDLLRQRQPMPERPDLLSRQRPLSSPESAGAMRAAAAGKPASLPHRSTVLRGGRILQRPGLFWSGRMCWCGRPVLRCFSARVRMRRQDVHGRIVHASCWHSDRTRRTLPDAVTPTISSIRTATGACPIMLVMLNVGRSDSSLSMRGNTLPVASRTSDPSLALTQPRVTPRGDRTQQRGGLRRRTRERRKACCPPPQRMRTHDHMAILAADFAWAPARRLNEPATRQSLPPQGGLQRPWSGPVIGSQTS
jgi:hypothetical protein